MSFGIDWWWPLQEKINSQFGFSKSREKVSSRLISRLYQPRGNLSELLLNKVVTVVGAGIADNEAIPDNVVIAADGAVSACLERNLIPDIIVTDLDGNLPEMVWANKKGSKLVVHAHGDNLSKLFEFSNEIQAISLTTTYPSSMTNCWGGFTDGDRSLMMSLGMGANLVNLIGFNFEEIGEYTGKFSPKKLQKLSWARKIVDICKKETGKVQII
ncbi:MAG: hypothetical protein BEU00_02640 [Marine Group III euryarchaeote CG-Epi3]|uniref:6-hydroxymethylpterin diphosphokinase MptE-like domain-containing protein n=1 Tax=Marine Group III euryarchaeote CG-Epi3 TaxID=1888997 RepID=A0A1J5TRB7_9ARCH|nr:MAG: hypothetical protein BEU00_02640 [Marine Group III euryarchaeote CG-Epi3]